MHLSTDPYHRVEIERGAVNYAQREYLADATGAELAGRASPLADALEALERRAQAAPLDVNPATASLYIVNPLRRQGVAALFSTHPPVAERVRRLRALDSSLPFARPRSESGVV